MYIADDPLPCGEISMAAFIGMSVQKHAARFRGQQDFKGSGISRCSEILRKYSKCISLISADFFLLLKTTINIHCQPVCGIKSATQLYLYSTESIPWCSFGMGTVRLFKVSLTESGQHDYHFPQHSCQRWLPIILPWPINYSFSRIAEFITCWPCARVLERTDNGWGQNFTLY